MRYLYDGVQLIGETVAGSGAYSGRHVPGLGTEETVGTIWGGSYREQPLSDERGSTLTTVDAAGQTNAPAGYTSYGQHTGTTYRFGFTGQRNLTGNIYDYRLRNYHVALGRFLQSDPLGYHAGANLQDYVDGDPVNQTDPLGLLSSRQENTLGGVVSCIVNNSIPTRPDLKQEGSAFYGCQYHAGSNVSFGASGSGSGPGAGGSTGGGAQGRVPAPSMEEERRRFCSQLDRNAARTRLNLPATDRGSRYNNVSALRFGLETSRSRAQFGEIGELGITPFVLDMIGAGFLLGDAQYGPSDRVRDAAGVFGGVGIQTTIVSEVSSQLRNQSESRAAAYDARLQQLQAQRAGICG